MLLKNMVWVALGGAIGSSLRYAISYVYQLYISQFKFPYPTLIANLLGCFIIGLVMGYAIKNGKVHNSGMIVFLTSGFCGGFTTFSAFSYECISLIQNQRFVPAATYMALSIILGLALTWAGYSIIKGNAL